MKKTYITPEAREYKVSTQHIIADSFKVDDSNTAGAGENLTKEEKSGSGIWDLYN